MTHRTDECECGNLQHGSIIRLTEDRKCMACGRDWFITGHGKKEELLKKVGEKYGNAIRYLGNHPSFDIENLNKNTPSSDWEKEFEELMPKTSEETISYPQFCAIRNFIRSEIINARWEEAREYKKLLCDVRDILRVPEGGDIIEYAKRVIKDADIYRQWQEEDA